MDRHEILQFLIERTQCWIVDQRERYRPSGRSLSQEEKAILAPHFAGATLDATRICRVPRIENPPFYEELGEVLIDLRQMAGITFGDTVLISEAEVPTSPPPALVFHELIHVVQYSVLGIPEFTRLYVTGWFENDMDYFRIPLEAQAYLLQGRFETGKLPPVSLEDTIRQDLGARAGDQ